MSVEVFISIAVINIIVLAAALTKCLKWLSDYYDRQITLKHKKHGSS